MIPKMLMVMLGVTNLNQSVTFYRDVLGLTVASQSGGFAFINAGGSTLVLSAPLGTAVAPSKSSVEIVFPVESVSASHRELSGRGLQFKSAPHEVNPGNWAADFADPDGHVLSIYGPK